MSSLFRMNFHLDARPTTNSTVQLAVWPCHNLLLLFLHHLFITIERKVQAYSFSVSIIFLTVLISFDADSSILQDLTRGMRIGLTIDVSDFATWTLYIPPFSTILFLSAGEFCFSFCLPCQFSFGAFYHVSPVWVVSTKSPSDLDFHINVELPSWLNDTFSMIYTGISCFFKILFLVTCLVYVDFNTVF